MILGDEFMWANAKDGTRSGTDKWYFPNKKTDNSYKKLGVRDNSGMNNYKITPGISDYIDDKMQD